jgi:hypothetical protein
MTNPSPNHLNIERQIEGCPSASPDLDRWVHPTFANLALIPQPLLPKRAKGAGFKVPLPHWERDLG